MLFRSRLISSSGIPLDERSDAFGDFRFDGLGGTGETYRLEVLSPSGEPVFTGSYSLNHSQWVGVITLPAEH